MCVADSFYATFVLEPLLNYSLLFHNVHDTLVTNSNECH